MPFYFLSHFLQPAHILSTLRCSLSSNSLHSAQHIIHKFSTKEMLFRSNISWETPSSPPGWSVFQYLSVIRIKTFCISSLETNSCSSVKALPKAASSMKPALTVPTTRNLPHQIPCRTESEALWTEFSVADYLSSYPVGLHTPCSMRDLTRHRSCINEWRRPEPGEGGLSGRWSGEGGVLCWIWGWPRKAVVRREPMNFVGHRVRDGTNCGKSDCQAEKSQSPSDTEKAGHSRKHIWALQARAYTVALNTEVAEIRTPAECLN